MTLDAGLSVAAGMTDAIGSLIQVGRSDGWGEFRDAADPAVLRNWDGPVQGYPNRIPPWPRDAFGRHAGAGFFRTSVQREASWAALCREIDVETDAATIDDVVPFLMFREHLGYSDGGVYCNLSTWPEVRGALEVARVGNDRCRVRIADWSRPPTRFGPRELGEGWAAWAHQFQNVETAGYDRNAYWGSADFQHHA